MTFALAAGDLFKIDSPGEFEETIISKCIDQYIATCLSDNSRAAKAARSDLPAIDTASSFGGIDASSIMSPTTPFSQSTLPSKSLLSRDSVDNTIYDPSFEPATGKDGRQGSVIELTDSKTKQALGQIIERIFSNCLREGRYRQVVGIAIEAKNLAVLRRVIKRAADDAKAVKGKAVSDELGGQAPTDDLMEYVLGVCMDIVQERKFRTQLLDLILHMLNDIPQPDYFAIAKCAVYLNADETASTLLCDLVDAEDREHLAIAYQIAFDLYDNGTQEFLCKVISDLPNPEAEALKIQLFRARKEKTRQAAAAAGEGEGEGEDKGESEPLLSDDKAIELEGAGINLLTPELAKAYTNIREILDGSKTIKLNVEFLYRNNHADISILQRVRDSLEGRNSIFHTAVTFCNAFMHAGTTHDKFFRDNLDWLSKAVNWSKFTATAALGVIHRGNISQAKKLLEPYMPREGRLSSGSSFSQGGALYAYGLIHANHGAKVIPELHHMFSASDDEHIMHGGALGLGIAGMASGNEAVFESLTNSLHSDSALSGEAVGLAMGLIMLGTGNAEAIRTMFTYAHETSHDKIVRGCALGMALVMYGRQESADGMIEALLSDPDPTLRYGGILTVALAYCGTGSNKAIRKLLHTAVSDTSDDVRRIAVMSLGFILFRKPGSVPRMVELLSESYNPHVRYGSAMALGISCAGTGLDEAIDLLEPMMKDPTDFVRQGALIALSMIMVQQNEAMNPKVASIRKTLKKVVGDRHEDAMTKFGAALALGIIDAGGRNCTIGLQTQTGNLNMAGIVGMAVFTQYWYWFPFTHFLSLSFSPTSIIGLDQDLEIPSFKFHSATRPSLFDYPPEQEVKAEEGPALIATAILSTTAQAKRRAQKKERATRTPLAAVGEKMDVDEDKKEEKEEKEKKEEKEEKEEEDKDDDDKDDKEDKEEQDDKDDKDDKDKKKKKAEKEKVGYEMLNMSRVLPGQLKYISFPATRYRAVKKPTGGPLVLLDTQPDEPKELIEEKLKKVTIEKAPVAGQHAASSSSARRGVPPVNNAEALRNLSNALHQSSTGNTSPTTSARNLQALTDFLSGGASGGSSRLTELLGTSGEGHRLAAEVVAEAARVAQQVEDNEAARNGRARRANIDGTLERVLMAVDDEADEDDEAPAPSSFDYYTDAEDDE